MLGISKHTKFNQIKALFHILWLYFQGNVPILTSCIFILIYNTAKYHLTSVICLKEIHFKYETFTQYLLFKYCIFY